MKLSGMDEMLNDFKDALTLEAAREVVKYHAAKLTERAQIKAPVDTGTLKRSIRVRAIEDDGLTARVAPSTDYAQYVELGTRFMTAQPYLKPALDETTPDFLDDLKRVKT